jgi:predicted RNase H-like HicB family nuclease
VISAVYNRNLMRKPWEVGALRCSLVDPGTKSIMRCEYGRCAKLSVAECQEIRHVRYRVLIEQDEDGAYTVEVPALPGCISQGRTRTEAIDNIKEAILAYVESLEAHGEAIPPSISEEVVEVNP